MIPGESKSDEVAVPLVTVIMPVYNSARTLRDSIQSVVAQSVGNWELLLVDDGSRDSSRDISRELAAQEPRIRTLFLDRNQGAATARNIGVELARGRFIAYLDSDDLWLPDKLELQLEAMNRTGAPISFTDYQWMDAEGKILDFTLRTRDTVGYEDLLRGNVIGLSTSMVDRHALGNPVMPPLRLNHDYAMWLGLTRNGTRALRVPRILTYYRHQAGSLSGNKIESFWTNVRILHQQESLGALRASWLVTKWAFKTVRRRFRHGVFI